jgi:hypothetical protein
VEPGKEPQLVNTWKPVTSEWHGTETPAVEVKGTPELEEKVAMAAACKQLGRSEPRTPLLIKVYAAYCFLRSGILLTGLCLVLGAPESEITKSIYAAMVPTMERVLYHGPVYQQSVDLPESDFMREQREAARQAAVRSIPGVLVILGLPYAVSGVMWVLRSQRARMFTMMSAGFSAASAAMNWSFSKTVYSDLPAPLTMYSGRQDLLLPGILLNLFVFLYLAYSPAVLEAYRVGEME